MEVFQIALECFFKAFIILEAIKNIIFILRQTQTYDTYAFLKWNIKLQINFSCELVCLRPYSLCI